MAPDIKNYVSTAEAAEITGYKQEHINLLCRKEKIVAEKIGRNWLVNIESLKKYKPGPQGFAAHPDRNPRKISNCNVNKQ
jgi:excisionase family DNA binding protein